MENPKLVAMAFWASGSRQFRTMIRADSGRFLFEGRIRYADGEHEYFPGEDWRANDIGEFELAKKTIESLLKQYNCPPKTIASALEDFEKCRQI